MADDIPRSEDPSPGGTAALGRALLRGLGEELARPRRRIRRVLLRARIRMQRTPAAFAGAGAFLAGSLFLLYALGAGVWRGAAAWAAFMATAAGLVLGGPLLLAYAWPAVAAGAAGVVVWNTVQFGPGALWLGVATLSGALVVYLAAGEMAPVLGTLAVSGALFRLGTIPGWIASAALLVLLFLLRRRVAASVLAAVWVGASCSFAAQAAWLVLGSDAPAEWSFGVLPGPGWLVVWVAHAAMLGGVLARQGPARGRAPPPRALHGVDTNAGRSR